MKQLPALDLLRSRLANIQVFAPGDPLTWTYPITPPSAFVPKAVIVPPVTLQLLQPPDSVAESNSSKERATSSMS